MPFIGNFFSTRVKLKLFGKQYALNSESKMRCLYFSETCALADRFIEVSLDFVDNKGYNMLKNTKYLR